MKETHYLGVKLDIYCKIPGGFYTGSPEGQPLVYALQLSNIELFYALQLSNIELFCQNFSKIKICQISIPGVFQLFLWEFQAF